MNIYKYIIILIKYIKEYILLKGLKYRKFIKEQNIKSQVH